MAKAAFCPALSLSELVGWTNQGGIVVDPGQLLMNTIVGLAQPIFTGGKLRANLKIAKLEQEEAANRYNGLISLIDLYIALGGGTK